LNLHADDLVYLVQQAELTVFEMRHCCILTGAYPSDALSLQEVARRFSGNTTIEHLSIDFAEDDHAYFVSIIDALQANTRLKVFALGQHHRFGDERVPIQVTNAIFNFFRAPFLLYERANLASYRITLLLAACALWLLSATFGEGFLCRSQVTTEDGVVSIARACTRRSARSDSAYRNFTVTSKT
jgi:hypothetical protein